MFLIHATDEMIQGAQPPVDPCSKLIPVDYDPFLDVSEAAEVSAYAAHMHDFETKMVNELMRDQLRDHLIMNPMRAIEAMIPFLTETRPMGQTRLGSEFVSSEAAKAFSLACFRAAYYHRNYSGDWAERIRAAIHDLKIAIADAERNREIFPDN